MRYGSLVKYEKEDTRSLAGFEALSSNAPNPMFAWVLVNKADLYYGQGGFTEPDIMKARLFTSEEAEQMLMAFPATAAAVRVEVEHA